MTDPQERRLAREARRGDQDSRRKLRRAKKRRGSGLLYGGIDPGRDGFLVVSDGSYPIRADRIPHVNKEVNYSRLLELFRVWERLDVSLVVLEAPQIIGRGSPLTGLSMGIGFGALRMGLEAVGISVKPMRPSAWQKVLKITGPKLGSAEDKRRKLKAKKIKVAQGLAPGYDFRASERSTKLHDGKAEAYLMSVVAAKMDQGED